MATESLKTMEHSVITSGLSERVFHAIDIIMPLHNTVLFLKAISSLVFFAWRNGN